MKTSQLSWFAFVALLAFVSPSVDAEDWRTLRGPRFDGSAGHLDADIASGDLQLKVVWKRSFGSGYSSAVRSGNRVVCAMADKKADQEFLVALSNETGETLWRTATGKIMIGENGSFDGPIATPAVDEQRAYHLSPHGDLIACSLSDGKVQWTHDLKAEYGAEPNFYGFGASPLIYADKVIVPVGGKAGAVIAFEPETGKVAWKAGADGAAFHAAVPVSVGGEPTVMVPGNTTLHAIDPASGEVRWSQPHNGASGGPVFSIVPVPLPDGGVYLNDSRDESSVINVSGVGAGTRWAGRDIRNTYCVPTMSGGLLCSYSSRFLVAVDPKTGDRVWRTRKPGNGFLASLAGRLVSATLDGSLHIGDVSKDGFDEVASIQVFESGVEGADGVMWSLPTISDRSIYIRSLGAIARVDVLPGSSTGGLAVAESTVGRDFAEFLAEVASSDRKQETIRNYFQGKSFPVVEGDYVHFVIQGDYDDVAVASELFGVRQERAMQRAEGTDLFYYGIKLDQPVRASYVFYADYVPTVDPNNGRSVVSSTLAGEMEPTFLGPAKPLKFSWFQKGNVGELTENTDVSEKKLMGRVEELMLKSKSMGEQINLTVYLPPGYDQSKERYPVVFVHEGNIALQAGNQAVILDDLITSGKVRPSMAVFIHKRFYPMLGPGAYPQMFGAELVPEMLRIYRISNDRDDRASLSGGFGATLSMIGTLPASKEIGRVGCHSPFAFEMLHPAIKQLAGLPNERCKFRIDWGSYEFRNPSENWDMSVQAKAIADILRTGGHQVETAQTPVGTDWVSWRTQSTLMWQFLVGKPTRQ